MFAAKPLPIGSDTPANPGKVSYASPGNGTSPHMSAELFKALTHVEMIQVPYRGTFCL